MQGASRRKHFTSAFYDRHPGGNSYSSECLENYGGQSTGIDWACVEATIFFVSAALLALPRWTAIQQALHPCLVGEQGKNPARIDGLAGCEFAVQGETDATFLSRETSTVLARCRAASNPSPGTWRQRLTGEIQPRLNPPSIQVKRLFVAGNWFLTTKRWQSFGQPHQNTNWLNSNGNSRSRSLILQTGRPRCI